MQLPEFMKAKHTVNNKVQYSFLDIIDPVVSVTPYHRQENVNSVVPPEKVGMFKNQDGNVKTHEWLTPPEIIRSLGEFDLDPCAPVNRPWETARNHFTVEDNGLLQNWFGRVWMNPPYDRKVIDEWMKKMAKYGSGIALTFARTDRNSFHNYVFPVAASILFIKQRLTFYTVEGIRAKANGGAPSVLIAYGEENSEAISRSGIKGRHVPLNIVQVVVVKVSESWRIVVKTVLVKLNQPSGLDAIYQEVEAIAEEKVKGNQHYKEKIRQVLQKHFTRVNKGIYTVPPAQEIYSA